MKSLLSTSLIFLAVMTISARHTTMDTAKIEPWLGEFSGTLHMYNRKGSPTTIPMKIKHFATDTAGTYGWFLIYGEDEEQGTRSYFLKEMDSATGHYIVDEKNSILLDTYMIGPKMISDFEVEGSTITSVYTLKDSKTITFEIFAGSSNSPRKSGGEAEIPLVHSNQVTAYHFAELKRVSPQDK